MVDVFQLFKLGTNAAKVMKATKHVYDAKVIKPAEVVVMEATDPDEEPSV